MQDAAECGTEGNMPHRLNIKVDDAMNAWIRKEAERMDRGLNGQVVSMLKTAKRLEEAREERDRDGGPGAA